MSFCSPVFLPHSNCLFHSRLEMDSLRPSAFTPNIFVAASLLEATLTDTSFPGSPSHITVISSRRYSVAFSPRLSSPLRAGGQFRLSSSSSQFSSDRKLVFLRLFFYPFRPSNLLMTVLSLQTQLVYLSSIHCYLYLSLCLLRATRFPTSSIFHHTLSLNSLL